MNWLKSRMYFIECDLRRVFVASQASSLPISRTDGRDASSKPTVNLLVERR